MQQNRSVEVERKDVPLAISARQFADRLGVSLRHIRRSDSAGLIPRPVRIGRSVRWPLDEVRAWMKAGAPPRSKWEHIRDRQERRNGRSD